MNLARRLVRPESRGGGELRLVLLLLSASELLEMAVVDREMEGKRTG